MWGFPRSAVVKNLPTNAGDTRDLSLIPGSERSPGVGNGNPFQYTMGKRQSLQVLGKLDSHMQKKKIQPLSYFRGSPGGSGGKEFACQCRRHRFNPWVRKIPWRRRRQPAPVFLPEKFHGQRSLEGYSPWGCKESYTT